jgi:hypothetical protein
MSEQQRPQFIVQQVEALIKAQWKAQTVVFQGAAPINDPFNEVSKMDPPDFAWWVLAEVKDADDDEPNAMSFQIGVKDGTLKIYCGWNYNIFTEQ